MGELYIYCVLNWGGYGHANLYDCYPHEDILFSLCYGHNYFMVVLAFDDGSDMVAFVVICQA